MKWPVSILIVLMTAVSLRPVEGQDMEGPADTTVSLPDSLRFPTLHDFIRRTDSLALFTMSDSLFLDRVITHDELMKWYHADFADLLWNAAGFYVHDLGSYGKPITASLNGLSNERWLVLLDGVPLCEPDVQWLNLNAVSLENIDRIEIVRGPASALYGPEAAAGVIHIRTRRIGERPAVSSIKFRSMFSSFQDIGVYFGRNLGDRMQAYVGGSSRETPGEQELQGLTGGFVRNLQRTRFSGSALFGGFRYLLGPHWAVGMHTQSNKDRFDAYGRNRFGDANAFAFTTEGGLRRDERTDYHFSVTQQTAGTLMTSKLYFTAIDRISKGFEDAIVPERYTARRVGLDVRYVFRWQDHALTVGSSYDKATVDRLTARHPEFSRAAWFLADKVHLGPLVMQPSFRWEIHSRFSSAKSAGVQAAYPLGNGRGMVSAGYTEAYPSLLSDFQNGLRRTELGQAYGVPQQFLFLSDAVGDLKKERIASLIAIVEQEDRAGLDRMRLTGYAHRIRRPLIAYPVFFNTDSMHVLVDNGGDASLVGADLELSRRLGIVRFTTLQSVFTAPDRVRKAIPAYRAGLTAYAERSFLRKNLNLTGFLSVLYYGRHSGYTFDDAPQRYYTTPRNADGGWIFKTRITAIIGEFMFFYEAENIFRARFTQLDGYDVTRQQYRFGLAWKLYD
jgi:hypothetical protein